MENYGPAPTSLCAPWNRTLLMKKTSSSDFPFHQGHIKWPVELWKMTSLLNYVRNWFGSMVQPSDFSYRGPLLMVNSTVAFPNKNCCPGFGHAGGRGRSMGWILCVSAPWCPKSSRKPQTFCSYGHLLVITGYKWDYTCYKCCYKYL